MSIATSSLRARIILLVLTVALLPLGIIGWWLTRTAARSGEELLTERLEESLQRATNDIGAHWTTWRSALLDLADRAPVQQMVATGRSPDSAGAAELSQAASKLDPAVVGLAVQDPSQRTLWSYDRADERESAGKEEGILPVRLGLYQRETGTRRATLIVRLRPSSLFGTGSTASFVTGSVTTLISPETGASLLAVPFDPSELTQSRFQWAAEDWIVRRRAIGDPRVDLVVAAPITPFTQPFNAAARRGLWVLLVAASVALAIAIVITRQMTRALSSLAAAADALSAGDLDRRIDASGRDEVGRVARAFNGMADSVERTLAELSRREALAAVGEFASELAHEVRNPLTAIRLDLQVVEEDLPIGSRARTIQAGALEEIIRLDATVASVLRLARSGKIESKRIDVLGPLQAAVRSAQSEFERRSAVLLVEWPDTPVMIDGDSIALTQLFVNLLLNAAHALSAGQSARLDVSLLAREVAVILEDNGCGIPPDALPHIRDPFFSTKNNGTGLGLSLAERTVRAHGGSLHIASTPPTGTRVEVRLPLPIAASRTDVPAALSS